MKSEKWQGISGTLIHDETKGIIIDKNEKSDSLDYFSEKLKTDGKPLKEVREKIEMLEEQMAEQWGVTEEMKMQDQMEWVRRMNNIQATAEEIAYKNIIFM